MLLGLRLKNLAIVDSVELELGPGLTVLTGETGAGKSLLVEALKLLWGSRGSADLVRTGADEATVEARFEIPASGGLRRLLEQQEIAPDGDEDLIIRRSVRRDGKSRVVIADHSVTVGTLAAISAHLIAVVSQHEHQSLMDPDSQLDLLDEIAGTNVLLAEAAQTWEAFRKLETEKAALATAAAGRADRLDYLNFVLRELEDAELSPGEDDRLKAEKRQLLSLEKMVRLVSGGVEFLLEGDQPAGAALSRIAESLKPLAEGDPALEPLARRMSDLAIELDDLGRELERRLDTLRMSPSELSARLDEIETRLALIDRLCRKHGGTVTEVIARTGALREERDRLENHEAVTGKLDGEIARARKAYETAAGKLSEARRKAARDLAVSIRKELEQLHFRQADFRVELAAAPQPGPGGQDRAEFLFSANPGEPPKPLAKVASGGELSRVMLAVRLARTRPDPATTLVLDEVDAGIGGVTADRVGAQIRKLAGKVQILCVTHLPQIAGRADHHIRIEKQVRKGRSEVTAAKLGYDERVEELARMLGGESAAVSTRTAAREMLQEWKQAGN